MSRFHVAVLFARADSIYKKLPGCDVWDMDRDARLWLGGSPVVAHPPCRAWGRLKHFAKPRHDERDLAIWSVAQVRRWGGVLEHPAFSSLWGAAGLPSPGETDDCGGHTLPIHQSWFGHRAEKATFLYIAGLPPSRVPPIPLDLGYPSHIVGSSGRRRDGSRPPARPEVSKAERERTPPALAIWLIGLAGMCNSGARA